MLYVRGPAPGLPRVFVGRHVRRNRARPTPTHPPHPPTHQLWPTHPPVDLGQVPDLLLVRPQRGDAYLVHQVRECGVGQHGHVACTWGHCHRIRGGCAQQPESCRRWLRSALQMRAACRSASIEPLAGVEGGIPGHPAEAARRQHPATPAACNSSPPTPPPSPITACTTSGSGV